jgi:hypothetical protein
VQSAAVGHDTALTWTPNAPAGTGMAWMVHVLPSQGPASGSEVVPWLMSYSPTAVQSAAVGHDTPSRTLKLAVGSGVAWTVQRVPSQCSARVTGPALLVYPPTAVQPDDKTHETASNWPFLRVHLGQDTGIYAVPEAIKVQHAFVPDACRGTGHQNSLQGDSVLASWLRAT